MVKNKAAIKPKIIKPVEGMANQAKASFAASVLPKLGAALPAKNQNNP
jgi:hypothetical protein